MALDFKRDLLTLLSFCNDSFSAISKKKTILTTLIYINVTNRFFGCPLFSPMLFVIYVFVVVVGRSLFSFVFLLAAGAMYLIKTFIASSCKLKSSSTICNRIDN